MINLQLTEQEAQIVVAALLELKLRDGMSAFLSIKSQLEKHYEKTPIATAVPEKKEDK